MTLEDETGSLNPIVREKLANRQRRELLSARLLACAGTVQRQGEVLHLVASRLTT